jgi:hypothetical protein
MARKAARKTVGRKKAGGKRRVGRPTGFKCSKATRAKMAASARARWKRGGKKVKKKGKR